LEEERSKLIQFLETCSEAEVWELRASD
jgi:hypothetical protein